MGPAVLFAGSSDTGRVRPTNQDCHGHVCEDGRHLFIVADGMGHEQGGGVASETVVDVFCRLFRASGDVDPADFFTRAFTEANTEILRIQADKPELDGIGSTAVAVVLDGGEFWHAHVGDSRLYMLRGSEIRQLTEDHTLVQQMVAGGLVTPDDAKTHPRRHVLNRAIGRQDEVVPEICAAPTRLVDGDSLVLCTDGTTDLVSNEEIAELATELGPGKASRRIVDLANSRGGHDNITVQIIHRGEPRPDWDETRPPAAPPVGGRPRWRRWGVLAAAVMIVAAAVLFAILGSRARSSLGPADGPGPIVVSTESEAPDRPVDLLGTATGAPTESTTPPPGRKYPNPVVDLSSLDSGGSGTSSPGALREQSPGEQPGPATGAASDHGQPEGGPKAHQDASASPNPPADDAASRSAGAADSAAASPAPNPSSDDRTGIESQQQGAGPRSGPIRAAPPPVSGHASPRIGPDPDPASSASVMSAFREAQSAFDDRRYLDAIRICDGLLAMNQVTGEVRTRIRDLRDNADLLKGSAMEELEP